MEIWLSENFKLGVTSKKKIMKTPKFYSIKYQKGSFHSRFKSV